MDKATVESVMAKAMMLVGALGDSCEAATSLPFLEAVTALRAEVERLAQAAPTEAEALRHLMGMGEAEIDAELLTSGIDPDDAVKRAVRAIDGALAIKAERRAIMYGDIVHNHVCAMRAAVVASHLESPEAGMRWIVNTLFGPGHLPDVDEAIELGGAQAMFDKEMAEHEAFRAAHPAPVAAQPSQAPVVQSNLEAIRGAVARGWCHPKNSHKAMDSDLALAIADDVSAINAAPLVQSVPVNCGTSYCSCIECVVEPKAVQATSEPLQRYTLRRPKDAADYMAKDSDGQWVKYDDLKADRASSGATTQAIPFSKDSWQHAVDNQLVAFGRTSQEFANPHEALAWLAIMNMELGQSNAGATTQAVRMLTREELNDVALSEQVGWGPGEYVEAVQLALLRVNAGRTIPADGVIGGAA